MLSFDIQSGNGSNGQHGSDGLQGKDGVNAPNGEKLMWGGSRKHVCGTFTSVSFLVALFMCVTKIITQLKKS